MSDPNINWDDLAATPPDPEAAEQVIRERRREKQAKLVDWHTRDLEAKREAELRARAADEIVNGREVVLRPASSVRLRAVRWGWDRRMPLGELTLLPGREGTGKSTLLAWLAAQLTTGMLPGVFHGQPRSIIYAATEDSWERTIAPRMLAAGADLDLVYRIDVEVDDFHAGKGGTGRKLAKLSLPVDNRLLLDACRKVDAAAVMLDPAISVISDRINTFKAQELRGALEPLRATIEQAGVVCAGLVHFNKSKDVDALTAISGSRAWVEVARAVVAVARDKDAEEGDGAYTCVVSQVKNNLGRLDLPHLTYTIDSVIIDTDDGPSEVGALRWTGESDRSAEDLLRASNLSERVGELAQQVVEFVRQRREETGSAVPAREIFDEFRKSSQPNVRKVLERCTRRGDLVRPMWGHYDVPGIGATPAGGSTDQPRREPIRVQSQRPCMNTEKGCEELAEPGAPVCTYCAKNLDREDRKTRAIQDPLPRL